MPNTKRTARKTVVGVAVTKATLKGATKKAATKKKVANKKVKEAEKAVKEAAVAEEKKERVKRTLMMITKRSKVLMSRDYFGPSGKTPGRKMVYRRSPTKTTKNIYRYESTLDPRRPKTKIRKAQHTSPGGTVSSFYFPTAGRYESYGPGVRYISPTTKQRFNYMTGTYNLSPKKYARKKK